MQVRARMALVYGLRRADPDGPDRTALLDSPRSFTRVGGSPKAAIGTYPLPKTVLLSNKWPRGIVRAHFSERAFAHVWGRFRPNRGSFQKGWASW